VSLAVLSLIFALVVGLPVGYLAAARSGGPVDRAVALLSSVMIAIPQFVKGVILVAIFAVSFRWLPSGGYTELTEDPLRWLMRLILPAVTLGLASAAEIARQVRGSFVDTLEQDFIRTAVAKGMPSSTILAKHALKAAATPIVIVTGLQLARILGGVVVVERIFALDGIGSLAISAVSHRDIAVIQGVVVVAAIAVVLVNVLTDVFIAYLNPRSRARG